jgi:predicted RNase H-like HicB family nuclease
MYYHEQGRDAMRLVNYRILFREEPEGGYTVIVPALPGCVTFGETVDEAIAMAREAVEVYIESLREKGEEVPAEEGYLEYRLTVEVPG